MTQYAISAIRWRDDRRGVQACRLNRLIQLDGKFSLVDAFDALHDDVAILISSGHQVWVTRAGSDGSLSRALPVMLRGMQKNLFTVPLSSLFELEEFDARNQGGTPYYEHLAGAAAMGVRAAIVKALIAC